MPTDRLSHVLDLARRGLRVFPLIENGKTPAFAGWQDAATSDEATLTAWFTGQYKHHNVGVATGRGVFVLDADVKNGGRGLQSLDLLDMVGLDLGLVVETTSGGRHAYFTAPPDARIPNSVRALADYPDIDVRGDGGLVVAPGTIVDGKAYKIVRDEPIPAAPQWAVALVQSAKKVREKSGSLPVVDLDKPDAIERARLYLDRNAPRAELGQRDDVTFKVAAHIKDYGLSEPMVLDLMLGWNEAKVEPPQEPDEVEHAVRSAFAFGTSAPGAKSAEAEFDVVEIVDLKVNPTSKRQRLYRVKFDEAVRLATSNVNPSLIADILDQHSFGVVYGPSNSGKTFLALSLAYHVTTALPWAGHETSKGAVIYIVAEGGRGINKRLAALNKHYKPTTPPPLDIIPCPVDLRSSDADVKRIVQIAHEAAAEHNQPLRLIVIDTLSRALAGGDENASTDMGAFVMNIDKLRLATSATVLVVHHTGKNVANGARGWSGLRAAIDTEIEVGEGGVISFEKQRDLEMIDDIRFRLEVLNLGKGATGKDVTSCVLVPLTTAQAEFEDGERNLPRIVKDYFEALTDLGDGAFQPGEWDQSFEGFCREAGTPVPARRTMHRWRTDLKDAGWVVDEGRRFRAVNPTQE